MMGSARGEILGGSDQRISFSQFLLLVFTFLLPFRAVPLFTFGDKIIQAADMIFILLAVVFSYDMIRKKVKFIKSPVYLPFIFYLAAHLLSLLNAGDKQKGIVETWGVLYLFFIFLIGFHLMDNRLFLKKFIGVWLAALTAVVIFGLVGLFEVYILKNGDPLFMMVDCATGRYRLMHDFMPRVCSILGNPNMLMSYFILSIGFLACSWNNGSRMLRLMIIAIVIMIILLSSLTISRDIVGLFICMYLCLLGVRRISILLKRAISLFLIFAVAILLPIFVILTIWEPSKVMIAPVGSNTEEELVIDFHRTNKSYYYEYGLQMFGEHPFIGSGSGNYNLRLREHYLKDRRADPNFAPFSANDPHSTYLGLLAETGILGFLSFFSIIGLLIATLIKNMRQLRLGIAQDGIVREMSLFIIAGLAGILCQAFTMDIQNLRHLWVIFALGFALSCKNHNLTEDYTK